MTANKPNIKIGGVETFSTVDFPNKIAAAVFMQGCPWRCPFCYNSHLQPYDAETDFLWDKFLEFLEKRKGMLEAVVFSGGDPLVQDALVNAINDVKRLGYEVGLHTGGFRPALFEKILPELVWVGFDIKAPFDESKYKKAIGGINHLKEVKQSLGLLLKSGIDFECRTTCDPRILEIEDIYTIAKELSALGVKKYHLQKYRPIPGDNTPEFECEKFFEDKNLIDFLKSLFSSVELRT